MTKWYAVYRGRVPGVYAEWSDCQAQVNGFKGNSQKGFKTRREAEASYLKFMIAEREKKKKELAAGEREDKMTKNLIIVFLLIVIAFLLYLIIV